jgi:phosphatidylinositol alpha-mannosyltransferase
MRIGMVCPYSFDVPGGVQSHVLQLAEVMHARGHDVSVLAPSSADVDLPDYVVSGGRAVPIPYNGSVARLRFGPATHRKVKRWLAEGSFDVLHLHEPNAPSLSMLALMVAEGPIVATFHTSTTKSLTLSVFQGILRPWHEKIVGRIAVSDLARRWQMEALGSDAVEIPNGVDTGAFAHAPLLDGYPRPGKSVLFLGRFDERRKGMAVLLRALPALIEKFPDLQILIVGRGDEGELCEEAGRLASHLKFLGQADDAMKASALRSADAYCAPNTGGESFGIVLVEAMAAGTPVVASDLDAFRRVLRDGEAGRLVPIDNAKALAAGLIEVLSDDQLRARYINAGTAAVRRYDWSVVAQQIMRVYETVAGTGATVQVVGSAGWWGYLPPEGQGD